MLQLHKLGLPNFPLILNPDDEGLSPHVFASR